MADEESSFSSPEAAIAHYRDLVDSLQSQLTDANDDIKEFTESSKELQDELEQELARMEKSEKEMRRGLDEARTDVEQWKTKYTTALREHTATMTHMQRELESLRISEKQLRTKLRDMELDNDDLEKAEREKDSSLQDLENRYGKSIERIALLEEELVNKAQLDEEVQRLKDELRDLHEEMAIVRSQAVTTYPPAYPRAVTPTRTTPSPQPAPTSDPEQLGQADHDAFATPTRANPQPTVSTTPFSPPSISLVNPTPARLATPSSRSSASASASASASSSSTDAFGTPVLPSPPPPVPDIPAAYRPSSGSGAALARSTAKRDLAHTAAASAPSRIGTPKSVREKRADGMIRDMRDMTDRVRQLTSRLDSRRNLSNMNSTSSGIPRASFGSPGGANSLTRSTTARRLTASSTSTLGRSVTSGSSGTSSAVERMMHSRTSSRSNRTSTEEERSTHQSTRPPSRSGMRISLGRTSIPVRPPSRLSSLSASTATTISMTSANGLGMSTRSETPSLRDSRSPTPSSAGPYSRPRAPWGAPHLATSTRARRAPAASYETGSGSSSTRPSSVVSNTSSLGVGRPSSAIEARRPSSRNGMLGTSIAPSGARRPSSGLGLSTHGHGGGLRKPSIVGGGKIDGRMELRRWMESLAAVILLITLGIIRLIWVLRATHANTSSSSHRKRRRPLRQPDEPASLAVFLGSGGHTAEMMRLLCGVDWDRYSTRIYLIGMGDKMSEDKALALEESINGGHFTIFRIPRARKVHQSYLTSPFTTLYSLLYCLRFLTLAPLIRRSPRLVFADVVLLNGPGSCVPIVLACFLPRLLALPSPGLLYIESLARTRRLSASARLIRPFVDRFFVQWESLREALRRGDEEGGNDRWRLRARVECQGWLV
ncbi:BZ3500_MvSof-1268-A1-R1_Chr7-1g09428 [Microbotryum saponariae]|uniref:UDP-N-acetylglucosamine transferase subunit ALG14 n=1 Tax=Microbotryum saponariae TaxID=289078 RepID=A0A2X0N807_9BASI|nr:BZ3501_MvSof-1269-A2-R1_Chr7-1g09133 [Microbotryum saponariae]SDA03422.1 BZ3500_MvSof-1268-A1-R1_Chr7-1g09428 [Microbotryum saponariae]